MVKHIINFLVKLSNIFQYMAQSLRNLNLHEEYYVYVPSNYKPRYIHKSYKSARDEAERLRDKLTIDEYVEVLQIVNRFEGSNPPF